MRKTVTVFLFTYLASALGGQDANAQVDAGVLRSDPAPEVLELQRSYTEALAGMRASLAKAKSDLLIANAQRESERKKVEVLEARMSDREGQLVAVSKDLRDLTESDLRKALSDSQKEVARLRAEREGDMKGVYGILEAIRKNYLITVLLFTGAIGLIIGFLWVLYGHSKHSLELFRLLDGRVIPKDDALAKEAREARERGRRDQAATPAVQVVKPPSAEYATVLPMVPPVVEPESASNVPHPIPDSTSEVVTSLEIPVAPAAVVTALATSPVVEYEEGTIGEDDDGIQVGEVPEDKGGGETNSV